MGQYSMKVAVPIKGRVYHQTAADVGSYLKKKAVYYYRFIANDYSWKQYRWVPSGFKGNLRFWMMIFNNLGFIGPFLISLREVIRRKQAFWIIHAPFLWYMTLIYGLTTLLKIRNFFKYA